jgi:hypothetical protein
MWAFKVADKTSTGALGSVRASSFRAANAVDDADDDEDVDVTEVDLRRRSVCVTGEEEDEEEEEEDTMSVGISDKHLSFLRSRVPTIGVADDIAADFVSTDVSTDVSITDAPTSCFAFGVFGAFGAFGGKEEVDGKRKRRRTLNLTEG